MELKQMPLCQFPKLAAYVLPEDKNSDSVLETNIKSMCDGQMELGVILSRYWGDDSKEDADKIIYAMKVMAMVYEELNRIKYEILHELYK